ncbi:MAG: alpha/beta hydrolase, partial [Gemmatimonadota bacterium]
VNEVFARAWCDGPHRRPEDVDPLVREKVLEMLAGSELRWRYSGLAQTLTPPAVGRLAEIDVTTLAVVGDIDMPDILEIVDLIVAQVPGARRVVIPDVAHMVNMEKPQEFNTHLTEFLAGLH